MFATRIILPIVLGILVACSTTPTTTSIAAEAQPPVLPKRTVMGSVDPVNVPADLSNNNIQSSYPVPEVTATNNNANVNLLPPGSGLQQSTQKQQSIQTATNSDPAISPVVTTANNSAFTPTSSAVAVQPNPVNSTKAFTPANSAAKPAAGSKVDLLVKLPYNQAWAQVGKSLPTTGYPVMEQDNFSGTYYILDKVGSGGSLKRDTAIYQIHLEKQGDKATAVTLLDQQNRPADSKTATRILGALKNKIS